MRLSPSWTKFFRCQSVQNLLKRLVLDYYEVNRTSPVGLRLGPF